MDERDTAGRAEFRLAENERVRLDAAVQYPYFLKLKRSLDRMAAVLVFPYCFQGLIELAAVGNLLSTVIGVFNVSDGEWLFALNDVR